MTTNGKDAPGVVAIPPLIYLAFLAAGILLDYIFPVAVLPDRLQYALGFALIAAAATAMPFVLRQFFRAGTSFDVRKPASVLVTDGPYRYSRNPAYLALTFLYAGIGIAADSLWVLVLLLPILAVMRYGVILPEERYLERKFGEDYLRYKRSVRRWL